MNIGLFAYDDNKYLFIISVMVIISIIAYLRLGRRAQLITTAAISTAATMLLKIIFIGVAHGRWYWSYMLNPFDVIPLLFLALLVSGVVFFIAAMVDKKSSR